MSSGHDLIAPIQGSAAQRCEAGTFIVLGKDTDFALGTSVQGGDKTSHWSAGIVLSGAA